MSKVWKLSIKMNLSLVILINVQHDWVNKNDPEKDKKH